jgi:hypothetical protein
MAAKQNDTGVEFRVTLRGINISETVRHAMEASVRRAVLAELADIDIGPEDPLIVRPMPEKGISADGPINFLPIILGLVIETVSLPGTELSP